MKVALSVFVLSIAMTHAAGVMAAGESSPRISVAPKGHYAPLDKLPDWGGAWFVTFVPGAGATFRVRLPVANRLSARTS